MSMDLMVQAMKIRVGNPLRKLVLLKLADNWKPFCDALVDVCWKEERHADKEFQKATDF